MICWKKSASASLRSSFGANFECPIKKSEKEKNMENYLSRIAVAAGLAAVLSLTAGAATSEWKIDPQHSSAQFSVRHMAISTVRGAFSKVNGTLVLDDKDVTKSTVDLTIRGTTREAVLDVEGPTAPMKDPWGNQRVAASASSRINRQDFGVKWNATLDNGGVVVGDDVNITIDAEMIKQAPAKSAN